MNEVASLTIFIPEPLGIDQLENLYYRIMGDPLVLDLNLASNLDFYVDMDVMVDDGIFGQAVPVYGMLVFYKHYYKLCDDAGIPL